MVVAGSRHEDVSLSEGTNPSHDSVIQSVVSEKTLSSFRLVLTYLSACFAILLAILDITVVSTALYTIATEFNTLIDPYWVILGYSLAELDTYHQLSMVFAFSLACGFATSLQQLIIVRVFQGVGAAGLYALGIVVMVEISPPKMLPFVSGLIGGVVAVSGILGPIVGGLLTRYADWRWIFWMVAIISFVSMITFIGALPSHHHASQKHIKSVTQLDHMGSILLLGGSVLLVFALEEGGIRASSWNSGAVIGSLTASGVLWLLLLLWEFRLMRAEASGGARIASAFPLSVLHERRLAASILTTALTAFSLFIAIFFLPLRLQIVNNNSPASSGLHILPLLVATGSGSFFTGPIAGKLKDTSLTSITGSILVLIGTELFSTFSSSSLSLEKKLFGSQILLGFGAGMNFSSVSIGVSQQVKSNAQSVIHGVASQARLLGGGIGIAACNAVLYRRAHFMLDNVLSAEEIRRIIFSTHGLESLDDGQIRVVRVMYADAGVQTMRVCVYISAVAVVASLFTLQIRFLRRN